ncbi:type III-A CRISPR-associated RAMP protein Csm4 [Desulfoglaeba alkanexedens]|uniref:CRISPR system Cms protein Csm4 n=1 Tax=Desulfoglaeba alkanexedens ALDC TaxID=980445 RepID=A0A4P8L646_9BACT|nr:RAMP superfamily CRISPR-associated protein [Desulfoglaeba alkanexedens]QCQ23223.1 hypothetical protein FDQ92_14205 [Desulfoglaeba alkanexedens ALDC]
MPTYRITLTLSSPLATPLVSGTIWGHLAWALRYLEGERALEDWLDEQDRRPWLLSSQMPAGMLPRPLLKPSGRSGISGSVEEMQREKTAGKFAYIPESTFLKLRNGMSEEALIDTLKHHDGYIVSAKGFKPRGLKAHNSIDRSTGTTPETGGLFFEEVIFPGPDGRRQIFLQAGEPCEGQLERLLTFVGETGFGSNASTGNGHFQWEIEEEKELFSTGGNRAMSLSHGVISENMRASSYKQHVHFGKLGGDLAKGGYSPFKYPILMAQPGTTFDPADTGPFGAIIKGVHHDPALAQVRHYAMHLPISFTEVDS